MITRRGYDELCRADVVITDRLAPVELLDDLAEGVEVISVGKVPRTPSISQEEINALLIDRALAGKRVVRLKGGDSFVFGRGAEEVLACEAAGIEVDVVPGVTSAVAVPEIAGIPLTHRSVTQGFTVVSAHVPPSDPRSTVDWAALARARTTLVLMMGVHTLPEVSAALIEGGMNPLTPAAIIQDGGLPTQRLLTSALGTIGRMAAVNDFHPPAIVVVGDVVEWRNATE